MAFYIPQNIGIFLKGGFNQNNFSSQGEPNELLYMKNT